MKTYKKPTIKIRSFISESVVTASDELTKWVNTTGGTFVQKSIDANNANAMKVMNYTF